MSKTATIILILVSALVFIGVGFAVGQVVQAAINTPGNADDPLVSQSYVEQLVGQRTAALQTVIEELQAQIDVLVAAQKPTTPVTPPVDPNTPVTPPVDPNTPSVPVVSTGKVIQITGTTVNVRDTASTSGKKIASVAKGDELEYLGAKGDWYNVKLSDGKTGWIANWLGVLK